MDTWLATLHGIQGKRKGMGTGMGMGTQVNNHCRSCAARGGRAGDGSTLSCPACPLSANDHDHDVEGGVSFHPDSMLARMEDRLAALRDAYFTHEAVMGRIAEFIERPWDSALTCEGKAGAKIVVMEG